MYRKLISFALFLMLFCSASLAETAPWYKWRSKLDGNVVCSQTSPGDGWEKISGPYKTVRCDIPGRPGLRSGL
ncbi:DUF4124 domain-containing protein [Candidatus Methylospira mobilis]|uniref:DUF4124 domain-containing protein n=1 Tax=Candidatus Methylospira mobilis TaxID=1808979 RepID=A0A5Q0BLW9_9GAMM|nr:hypothetical protein [Candidatus Methylospira mobilis]QFY44599.1 DUF4124 domain-containing protein [Candidatus Methylospira mobilis]WNV05960.1 hypothetical protein RP726_05970 [Candidatus Methylospira mobilis]